MKLTALLNKCRYRDPTVFPAWEVLRMATIEGAQAVGLGDDVAAAREVAYQGVGQISWRDHYYRRDIGHRALAR